MDNVFLGKPSERIIAWIKKHHVPPCPEFEGDIYVLDDGTEVKVSKDDPLAQGDINIRNLPNDLTNDKCCGIIVTTKKNALNLIEIQGADEHLVILYSSVYSIPYFYGLVKMPSIC